MTADSLRIIEEADDEGEGVEHEDDESHQLFEPTDIASLTPDPKNANRGTQRGRGMLDHSLRQLGAGRSIVTDRRGAVIAGNKTLEVAHEIGLAIRPVHTNGEELVVVIRDDLELDGETDGGRARQLAYADNRISQVDYDLDLEQLALDLSEEGVLAIDDLDWLYWEDELDALLDLAADESGNSEGAGGDDYDTTPQEGPTRVKPGDVWACGSHRVMCGDSTSAADVARLMGGERAALMVTDPPYGVNYDPTWRQDRGINDSVGRLGEVANDDRADWSEACRLFGAQVAYVWHGDRGAVEVGTSLLASGFEIIAQIVWVKDQYAISRGDYHFQHEACWYAHAKGKTHNWQGARNQSTVWHINRVDKNEDALGHSTQKPLECMSRPIDNNSKPRDVIVDPFLGSGTTLIAAERLRRKCYGMEIEPKYCDVIISRWEAETGKTAMLLSSAIATPDVSAPLGEQGA